MAAVVVVGVAMGAVHLDWHDGGTGTKVRKVLGIGTAVAGGFLFLAALEKPREAPPPTAAIDAEGRPVQLLSWGHSEMEAVAKAKSERRPMIVDFTAEWCGACKTLAKETLSDPRVMAKAGNFVGVKVDATNDEDPQVEAVKDKYKVVGLPTLVIYDSTGAERKRFTDFVPPEEFLAALEGVN
jgi:thiol:disulfide interchange protein DsbD